MDAAFAESFGDGSGDGFVAEQLPSAQLGHDVAGEIVARRTKSAGNDDDLAASHGLGNQGPAPHGQAPKINFFYFVWGIYVRCSGVGVGMMHARREDFWVFGGFDETIYAAEDVQLAYDLKKLGKPRGQKFKLIHKGWIITSTRKIDQTPLLTMLAKLIGFSFGLQKKIRSKEYCEHWYEKAAR